LASLETAAARLAGFIWGPPTVWLLLGVGVYLTVRLRLVQLRYLPFALRLFVGGADQGEGSNERRGDVAPRAALSVSLATVVGNGNIAGVCTAIAMGGPGAVFWMWISALFGMATKLVEATLGQRYRVVLADGSIGGGPMYYLRDGLGLSKLAGLFALVMGAKALCATSIVQSNSIAVALEHQFHVDPLFTGCGLAVLTWLVIIGGLKSIARVASVLAPTMVILYFGAGLVTLAVFASEIPDALRKVLLGAFDPSAIGGGMVGATIQSAMRYGLARGAYSNEAGTGTAAVFYSPARTSEPVREGLLASLDVLIDTMVVCNLTAFAVLVTGAWQRGGSTDMAASAFSAGLPTVGGLIVAVSSLLFGFSSLVGVPYYGETALAFLLGERIRRGFRWTYCLMVVFGATVTVKIAWSIGDILNGLMTVVNLVGVIGLSGVAIAMARNYFARFGRKADHFDGGR
jgi:AGCS family alanine or glycine:cation symporter